MITRAAAEYEVIPKGTILVDEFRGDRITGDTYRVVKIPKFGDPTEYTVCLSTIGEWCDCPGGTNHGHCKHVAMVRRYLENHDGQSKAENDGK